LDFNNIFTHFYTCFYPVPLLTRITVSNFNFGSFGLFRCCPPAPLPGEDFDFGDYNRVYIDCCPRAACFAGGNPVNYVMRNNCQYYLGKVTRAFTGYTTDESIRQNAASGGLITSLLLYLLKSGKIGGALVSRLKISGGNISAETYIARTAAGIKKCQGSVYLYIPILNELDKIKNSHGKLAVVGLPCQLKALRQLMDKDKKLRDKLLLIGLFCGHASKKELLLKVLEQKGIREKMVEDLRFRKGHWRGSMQIKLKNGPKITFPFEHFSTYQNLFFYCERFCLNCTDQTNEFADLSFGDIWDAKFKNNPIKHSLILTRSKESQNILEEMAKESLVYLNSITLQDVYNFQKRSLVFHKLIKARSDLGKFFGFNINCPRGEKAKWNDYPATFMVLFNIKLSESKMGQQIIFKIPRQIWFLYLVLFKLLTSF